MNFPRKRTHTPGSQKAGRGVYVFFIEKLHKNEPYMYTPGTGSKSSQQKILSVATAFGITSSGDGFGVWFWGFVCCVHVECLFFCVRAELIANQGVAIWFLAVLIVVK